MLNSRFIEQGAPEELFSHSEDTRTQAFARGEHVY